MFVLKLNSSGTFEWVYTPGVENTTSGENGIGIAVDSSGNVYTSGTFYGILDLTSGVRLQTSANSSRAFLFKLNSSGQYSN